MRVFTWWKITRDIAVSKDDYVDYVVDKLSGLGGVRSRAMFGGYGIFHEGLMFALIADGVLYFKVDDANREMYREAGSSIFPHGISYWEVPTDIFENTARLYEWAEISIRIAQAKAAKKNKKK
jgi:DNA transformation protein